MIFNKKQIEISERVMPWIFCAFAAWLLTHEVFDNTPAYVFAAAFGETAWALIFSVFGIFQFFATWSERRTLRRAALFLTSLVWIVWAILIVSAQTKGFGAIIYTSVAVTSMWTFIRAK